MFHALVLTIGFVVGGVLSRLLVDSFRLARPSSSLPSGVTASFGPFPIDLGLIKFSFGPVALDVSLLSLFGVLVAYLIARSLF